MSSPWGGWSWFGECGSPLRTEQSPWTWAVVFAFSPQVCLGVWTPTQKSLPTGSSGHGGSCYHCGHRVDERPGTSQKRGGSKWTSGMSPLHLTPAPYPHSFLDSSPPCLELLKEIRGVICQEIFICKGGQWLHCSSQLPDTCHQLVLFINLGWLNFLHPKL